MDTLYFFSALISSLFLPIFTCFLVKWKNPFKPLKWNEVFSIKEKESLLSQPLFWCSLSIPFFMFLNFGYFVWSDYLLSMTKDGFNTFIEISKLPLWLLAIAAPASVIIARAHGTAQTAKQIKELDRKNNLEHFYKHRSEFIEYLNKQVNIISETKKIQFNHRTEHSKHECSVKLEIYNKVFIASEEKGVERINIQALSSISKGIDLATIQLAKINELDLDETILAISSIDDITANSFKNLFNETCINLSKCSTQKVKFTYNGLTTITDIRVLSCESIIIMLNFINECISAIHDYINSEEINVIKSNTFLTKMDLVSLINKPKVLRRVNEKINHACDKYQIEDKTEEKIIL